jgi:hypothetical protein
MLVLLVLLCFWIVSFAITMRVIIWAVFGFARVEKSLQLLFYIKVISVLLVLYTLSKIKIVGIIPLFMGQTILLRGGTFGRI